MLNELYQAARAMRRQKVPLISAHQLIEPMGKNNELIVVKLDQKAVPKTLEILDGDKAGLLVRISHGSEGSSFPGFNLPTPLRILTKKTDAAFEAKLKTLHEALRDRGKTAENVFNAIKEIFPYTAERKYKGEKEKSKIRHFKESTQELVGWLKEDFANSAPELKNFLKLLKIVDIAKLELAAFANNLAQCILNMQAGNISKQNADLIAEVLFGKIHFKSKANVGVDEYWKVKEAADKKLKTPIYYDLADDDTQALPVADPRTSRAINIHLLGLNPAAYDNKTRTQNKAVSRKRKNKPPEAITGKDAYTGSDCPIPDKFPEPKLEGLGNTKLFANNTAEAGCFFRYGLGESRTFVVSPENIQNISAALFTLAGDDLAVTALDGQRTLGRTCRHLPGKQLLIAYLEDEPNAKDHFVELFGADASDEKDFAASVKPVLKALEGKVTANPNQRICLIAIVALDKANKQIVLNRSYTVREVMEAAKAWQAGADNCPPVSLPFFDKKENKTFYLPHIVPAPLDVASVINKVWSYQNGKIAGDFQRVLNYSDAYDVFIGHQNIRAAKTQYALRFLLNRMRVVFSVSGLAKTKDDFSSVPEPARWQALKAVALIGIFLDQQNYKKEMFMKETVYQVGRLIALADKLHFHYCKWVRTPEEKRRKKEVNAPSELIGNALFNAALDNPVTALARLAERIRPYKGWATTYHGDEAGIGHWLLRLMADCESQIKLGNLENLRMQDIHKAQMLLGYLADLPKSEDKK